MSSIESKSEESQTTHEIALVSEDSFQKRRRIETETGETDDPDKQIPETVFKLKKHLLHGTKFNKAVELMTQLIQTHFRNDIAELIIATIEDQCDQRDVLHKDFKSGCMELVEAVYKKRVVLNPTQVFRVDTLHILVTLQNKLITDDSFKFARCCSNIKSFIAAIPSYAQDLEGLAKSAEQCESMMKRRLKAIINCMKTAFKLYSTRPWSKQPVDSLFTSASDVRLHVPLVEREAMDELITILRNTQRKNDSYTGPTTIRTFNSTAHPLRSSKFDVLR